MDPGFRRDDEEGGQRTLMWDPAVARATLHE
jgi:hypothetical protein